MTLRKISIKAQKDRQKEQTVMTVTNINVKNVVDKKANIVDAVAHLKDR